MDECQIVAILKRCFDCYYGIILRTKFIGKSNKGFEQHCKDELLEFEITMEECRNQTLLYIS